MNDGDVYENQQWGKLVYWEDYLEDNKGLLPFISRVNTLGITNDPFSNAVIRQLQSIKSSIFARMGHVIYNLLMNMGIFHAEQWDDRRSQKFEVHEKKFSELTTSITRPDDNGDSEIYSMFFDVKKKSSGQLDMWNSEPTKIRDLLEMMFSTEPNGVHDASSHYHCITVFLETRATRAADKKEMNIVIPLKFKWQVGWQDMQVSIEDEAMFLKLKEGSSWPATLEVERPIMRVTTFTDESLQDMVLMINEVLLKAITQGPTKVAVTYCS
jgi:hypothetical protein